MENEKMNGLVAARNMGRGRTTLGKERKQIDKKGLKAGGMAGQPKKKRENEWISRGLKQGANRATLRKKEKMNGL